MLLRLISLVAVARESSKSIKLKVRGRVQGSRGKV